MTSAESRFADLFERSRHRLLAYAVRRAPCPEDAADVVAETFLVAWRRLDDVPAGEDAVPWLFGVARRVLANQRRGELRRSALADRLREELSRHCHPPALPPRISEAMDRLPEDDRELLRLLAWEELPREDIATVLGISRAGVRVRVHRARRRLRAALAALEEPTDGVAQRTRTSGQITTEAATATSATVEGR